MEETVDHGNHIVIMEEYGIYGNRDLLCLSYRCLFLYRYSRLDHLCPRIRGPIMDIFSYYI